MPIEKNLHFNLSPTTSPTRICPMEVTIMLILITKRSLALKK